MTIKNRFLLVFAILLQGASLHAVSQNPHEITVDLALLEHHLALLSKDGQAGSPISVEDLKKGRTQLKPATASRAASPEPIGLSETLKEALTRRRPSIEPEDD